MALQFPFERMQMPTWHINVLRRLRYVKQSQLAAKLRRVLWLNSSLASLPVEVLKSRVTEALYHLYSVSIRNTAVNILNDR